MKFQPNPKMLEAARNLRAARVNLKVVKAKVEPLQRRILEKHNIRDAETGEPILTASALYLADDDSFQRYLEDIHVLYRQEGFDVEFGYCPLLIAENRVRIAENALIDAMEGITQINRDDLNASRREYREEYIELTMQLLTPYL